MRRRFAICFLLAPVAVYCATPPLQVIRFGGSDQDTLAAMAMDHLGNYYLAGTTASLDLPARGFQPRAGGAPLYRIRGSRAEPLFPPRATELAALESDPTRAGVLYTAFHRALWKSHDAGATWRLLEADWPANADCNRIVASSNGSALYAVCAGRLFHSADAGDTWEELKGAFSNLGDLTIDPNDSASLWAVDRRLVSYHSADGGTTWTFTDLNLWRFAFNRRRPGLVFALGRVGYYVSRDAGKSWLQVPSPPEGRTDLQTVFVLPSGELLVVGFGLIQRTRDDGASWELTRLPDAGSGCMASPGPSLRADPRSGVLYLRVCVSEDGAAYRSDDGGATWARISTFGLPQLTADALSLHADGSADYFVAAQKSSDGFVAKLSPAGELTWGTYLGGPQDDSITAMALDTQKNIYVTGKSGKLSFVAKISADGSQRVYYFTLPNGLTPRALAVDAAGAAYVTGKDPGRVVKIDPTGMRIEYSVPIESGSAIAVDADGNAFVTGSDVVKIDPAGDVTTIAKLTGATANAIVLGPGGTLYVAGDADTRTFTPTAGAFQTRVPPTICLRDTCWANPVFVARFEARTGQTIYSTYLGGDVWETARALAVDGSGVAFTAGFTISRSFPTRIPLQGSILPRFGQNGFASAITADGSDAVLSTYLSDGRPFDAVAIALDPLGNPVVAGHNITPRGNGIPEVGTDVLIFHLGYSELREVAPRLDAVWNTASRTGTPVAAGQRVSLLGSAFTEGARVWFGDQSAEPLAVTDFEIIVDPPAVSADGLGINVSVELPDGRRSNKVLMPAGGAEIALYSADGTGTGQALALNADGTYNSPTNVARLDTVVTIPANGVAPPANVSLLAGLIVESVTRGAFPGLPGEVTLIRARVDPKRRFGAPSVPLLDFNTSGHQPVTLARE